MEPRKIDPWEARERERAKRDAWRQNKKSQSSSSSLSETDQKRIDNSPFAWEGGFDFQNNALPLGLLAAVVLLLLSSIPFEGVASAQAYRTFFTKAGSILLLFCAIAGGAVGKNAVGDVRRGPHPFLMLLLAWTTLSLFLAPFRGYAVLEFVRIVDGIAAYFLAGYALKNGGKQAANLTVGLLAFGCVLAFAQIAEIGQQKGGFAAGITMSRFGAHGNIGSVLLLLWPPALAFAAWPGMEEKRRLAALAAALVIGCALLAERARSSWIGAVAAVLVLAACYFLTRQNEGFSPTSPRSARRGSANLFIRATQSPLTLLGIGLVLFLVLCGGTARMIASRAASIGSGAAGTDATFQSRLPSWGGAARMASEKPLTGWGLGTFPVLQGRYTHTGDEVQAALSGNVDNLSLAHNYYLQWAADTGYVGLFLYGAFVAAYVATLLVKLPYLRSPFHQALAAGVLAVVVGSHIDALASPSHHFHGVWVLLWAWMGLGVAALRPAPPSLRQAAINEDDAGQVAPLATSEDGVTSGGAKSAAFTVWGSGVIFGAASVLLIAAFAARLHAEGRSLPRGVLEVVASGKGAGRAGTTLSWTAQYHNAQGQSFATSPGTIWSVTGNSSPGAARIAQAAQQSLFVPPPINAMDLAGANRRSEFRVLVPSDAVRAALAAAPKTAPQITVKATYFDAYGRKYEAWSARTLAVK